MKLLNYIHRLDATAFTWCTARRSAERLARIARVVSSTGDGHIYVVVPLVCWFIDNTQGLQLVIAVATALAIERPVYLAMKNGFKRRRPPEVIPGFTGFIEASDRFSFPSGHTSAAFLFATLYCSLVTVAMAPLMYTWAILVGLSRVFLGVHFPTDIVIGAMLGTTAALLAISITM